MPLAILVHGGAGPAQPEKEAEALALACRSAAAAGYRILDSGNGAVEAVMVAVQRLEDDPRFNAGRGSALTSEGKVEMDASVMDGATRRGGGVAAVRGVSNPVRLAYEVMARTSHVLLCGEGARQLALEAGLPTCAEEALVTPSARERLAAVLAGRRERSGGTVGAVACDGSGHLAAATSTGGMSGKRPGRVGDSPLLGCGTYAEEGAGAASATGWGEAIIRVVLAKFACDRMGQGIPPDRAAALAMLELSRVGGEGGIILANGRGELGFACNAPALTRAWVHSEAGEGWGHLPPASGVDCMAGVPRAK